jgi:hypothetical protein
LRGKELQALLRVAGYLEMLRDLNNTTTARGLADVKESSALMSENTRRIYQATE